MSMPTTMPSPDEPVSGNDDEPTARETVPYARIPFGILDHDPMPTAKAVLGLVVLTEFSDFKTGKVRRLPYRTFADRAGVSAETFGGWVKELVALGLVEVEEGRWNGLRTENRLTITVPAILRAEKPHDSGTRESPGTYPENFGDVPGESRGLSPGKFGDSPRESSGASTEIPFRDPVQEINHSTAAAAASDAAPQPREDAGEGNPSLFALEGQDLADKAAPQRDREWDHAVTAAAKHNVDPADVTAVFMAWRDAWSKNAGTKLDAGRAGKIAAALSAYPRDDIEAAVRGHAAAPFYRGANDRGKRYDDIKYALGKAAGDTVDAATVEKFRDEWLEHAARGAQTPADAAAAQRTRKFAGEATAEEHEASASQPF